MDEVESAWKQDPIERMRTYLTDQGHWDEEKEHALAEDCADKVEKEVEVYVSTGTPGIETMFDYMYANMPPDLQAQRDRAIEGKPLMAKVALVEAVTMALAHEMEHDESVVILGEDVGINGGVFPRHGRPSAALRRQSRDRHAAGGSHDRRAFGRNGDTGHETGCRSAVHGVHHPDDGPHHVPRRQDAPPHTRQADLPAGSARAFWRRHPRPRSFIRKAPSPCSPTCRA